MIYWSRICHSPKTMLGTYVKGCGRSDRVISEFYLKDIFVTLFKNDVLCQKLGKEFNPSPLGYACNSKFFREKSVFSWSWKKAECLLLETGTVCPNIGLPRWLSGKESACQWGRHKFDPWVRKIPWRWKWQPTPVFSHGESLGQGTWWATVSGVAKNWAWLSTRTLIAGIEYDTFSQRNVDSGHALFWVLVCIQHE